MSAPFTHGTARERHEVEALTLGQFQTTVRAAVAVDGRVVDLWVTPRPDGARTLFCVLSVPSESTETTTRALRLLGTDLGTATTFPALTPTVPEVHLFERELAEDYALVPEGHPRLRPVRRTLPSEGFYSVSGDAIHEVAVGPVHAGVIEPGHFRFQCAGEVVHHLEIALGYQHRGARALLEAGPDARTLHLAETLAGDASVAHATATCQAMEALSGTIVPPRALAIRAIALELERLANHVGDLGALANDVGFLPTASFCGRIRGDWLNATALGCGNRFGRSWIVPGGVRFDLEPDRARTLRASIDQAYEDTASAVNLLWDAPSVMSRFEDAGTVTLEQAREVGLVGPAARASGLCRDVRRDHPAGAWLTVSLDAVESVPTGDVYARAFQRWSEVRQSVAVLRRLLDTLPDGPLRTPLLPLRPNAVTVALVEGWRGEVAHTVATNDAGRFRFYRVVDPSFRNWTGLALALRGQQLSDFPLCNKSFNLSYCGCDL